MKRIFLIFAAWALVVSPALAALTDWQSEGCKWHYGRLNVRDPTVVYNNTSYATGSCPGYEITTPYYFAPCNFAIQSGPAVCSNGAGPTIACAGTFTRVPVDQFGVPSSAKAVLLTGNTGLVGPNKWNNVIYFWARAAGSTWALSPIHNGGYLGNISVPVPVGVIDGIPAIEIAWAINGTMQAGDGAWMNLILSGWCD